MNKTVDVITEFAHDVASSQKGGLDTAVDVIIAARDTRGNLDRDLRIAFEDLDRVESEMT